jgi:transcriptional regulator with XRE-family HTH domain
MTLKQARKALAWTQQQLEAASGVQQQHISDLENDRIGQVSYATVAKLVKALHKAGLRGVTAEELFPLDKERVS